MAYWPSPASRRLLGPFDRFRLQPLSPIRSTPLHYSLEGIDGFQQLTVVAKQLNKHEYTV